MPNWCDNILKITGPEEEIFRFVIDARGKPQFYSAEFRKENLRLVRDKKPAVNIQDAQGEEEALCFHAIVPIPNDILNGDYDPHGYQKEKELWGVKWGSKDSTLAVRNEGEVHYTFETPWAPPLNFLLAASEKYPELKFTLEWDESGMMVAGRHVFENGKITEAEEDKGEEFEVVFTVKYRAKVTELRSRLKDAVEDIYIPEPKNLNYITDSFEIETVTDSNGNEMEI